MKKKKARANGSAPCKRPGVGLKSRNRRAKAQGFEKHAKALDNDRKLAGGIIETLGAKTLAAAKKHLGAMAGYPSFCRNIGLPGLRSMMPRIPVNLRPQVAALAGGGLGRAIFHEGHLYGGDWHPKEAVEFKGCGLVDFHGVKIIAWRDGENGLEIECDNFFSGASGGREPILLVFENPSIKFMHGSMIVAGPGLGSWALGDGKPFVIGHGRKFRREADIFGKRINISELSAASERWPEFRLVYGHGGGERSHGLSIGSFECAIAFSGFHMACGQSAIDLFFAIKQNREQERDALWTASPERGAVGRRKKRLSL